MKEIKTEILIRASHEKVWEVLMDFDAYPQWNPFIRHISGHPAKGSYLEVHIEPQNSSKMKFKPKVLICETGAKFRWKGKVLMPGLFDGEHSFELRKKSANETLFIHGEQFSGLLVPLLWKNMSVNIKSSFELMNQKLKERAEMKN